MKSGRNSYAKIRRMRVVFIIVLICFALKGNAQVDTIIWQKKSALPQSLSACAVGHFIIDSDFYVVGGWIGAAGNTLSNNMWRYHIPTDSWSQMANLPFGGASSAASFTLNGKGYFLTAIDSINNLSCNTLFWEYDPATDNWRGRSNFPFVSRVNSSFFVFNNKGYVGQTNGCVSYDSKFWQYDPTLDEWSAVASLPADIIAGSEAVASLSASIYLFGGTDPIANFSKNVWRYNVLSDNWDSICLMPGLPRDYAVFWGLDSVIIGGAGVVNDNGNWYPANDYYCYNVSKNTWTSLVFQNLTDSASFGASFVWGKTAYYFGGATDLLYDTYNIGIWSADVSKYLTDTPTGINELNNQTSFTVYPNPSHNTAFSISTSESGDVIFSDALGRLIDERKLKQGVNQISLTTDDEVVFYHATLQYGATANGKVVFLR